MTACMQCGSLELRNITASEGPVGLGAELNLKHCTECDWQGLPIEFDAEADWQAFRHAQRGGKTEAKPEPAQADEPENAGAEGGWQRLR